MTAERQQFSLALGLAAALNGLLFLAIAWAMAVSQGLGASRRSLDFSTVASAEPEIVSLVLSPEPPPPDPAEAKRQLINSPDDEVELTPTDAATHFVSSQNLRAASEEAASPDGIKGRVTQQGLDHPFLDLRDSDFRDGEQEAARPPESPAQAPTAASPPAPAPAQATPPESSPASSAVPPTEETASIGKPTDTPPEKEPVPPDPSSSEPPPATSTPAPIAFRDKQAEALIPLEETPAPRPAKRQPAPASPPLTRIPDRVPESSYTPGLRKSKSLGTISNKGRSSVDAIATAEGRFGKSIRSAIEKTWRRRMLTLASLANPGLVEVDFEVDAKGRISNVRLANPGEANPVMQDCALTAVIDAKLPPPPPELLEELRDALTGGRMRCSFSFLIY